MLSTHVPRPATKLPRDAYLAIVGVTTTCPHVLMRALDAVIVLGCVPAELHVERQRASFRFTLRVADCPVSPARLADRLGNVIGIRAIRVMPAP